MPDLKVLAEQVVAFRDERDWKQFHNPKDVALSLMLESAELLEHFQWKNGEAIQETAMHRRAELADELADVLYYTLLMAHDLNIAVTPLIFDHYPISGRWRAMKRRGVGTDAYG